MHPLIHPDIQTGLWWQQNKQGTTAPSWIALLHLMDHRRSSGTQVVLLLDAIITRWIL